MTTEVDPIQDEDAEISRAEAILFALLVVMSFAAILAAVLIHGF